MSRPAIRQRLGALRFLDPADETLSRGDFVVFQSERGLDCAPVVLVAEHLAAQRPDGASVKLIRRATVSDMSQMETKWKEEVRAHAACVDRISRRGLEMRLVQTSYTFDFARLTFYYTAEHRVDFRELLKDLTGTFRRTRIDLRQIGVRDETKLLGGAGACGQELCCATFLKEFMPITIKLAKDQALPLHPTKLSGMCGRLKCCLTYEHDMVLSIKRELPVVGTGVRTPEGPARVVGHDYFNEALRVELEADERVRRIPASRVVPLEARRAPEAHDPS